MWRPPQRIRYTAEAGRMPTAAQAAASRLFSPVDVGPVRLEQRTWVPAMVPWRATEEGYVTDEVLNQLNAKLPTVAIKMGAEPAQ